MSKRTQILTALLNGEKLTSLTIADKFRTTRGQARISELKKNGFPIQSKTEKTKKGNFYNVWFI
jgi:beta-xylosidase